MLYIFGEYARVMASVCAEENVGLQVKRLLLFSDLNQTESRQNIPNLKLYKALFICSWFVASWNTDEQKKMTS
jgi:hypothetical protein